ncbi:hypothetical protein [Streptomyces glaucescens]|uniref:Uncharacterized protein n=1 Tax=Streptomyces glaucescens TaxID=1907 RepID=A0A089XMJ1_STRGA|nr:hypothetical protein [Streptomyces glaucescens]AIR96044.1 hypothetical protein SGLAU_00060 [Streptomyces glaucescens]AIS02420.1 hypothetical protein SGLAU_32440 [Streptomyces glaucescens]
MADHRDCLHLLHTLVQRHAAKSVASQRVQSGVMLPLSQSSTRWGGDSDKEAMLALLTAVEDHQKALDDLRLIYASRAVEKGASLADLGRAWHVSRKGARHRWNVLKRRLRPDVSRQRPRTHYLNGVD